MSALIVFGGRNSLDFSAVRHAVLRIPEVSLKIEEAQRAWDRFCRAQFSFHHFLSSEDSVFFNNINLKSIALSIVQLGLFDRYSRQFGTPNIVAGAADTDSPLRVVSGECSLSELVARSPACGVSRPLAPLQLATELVLNGRALPQFEALRLELLDGAPPSVQNERPNPLQAAARAHLPNVKSVRLGGKEMNIISLLQRLLLKEGVSQVVHVGPGAITKPEELKSLAQHIHVIESIDADPMLGWFWQDLRHSERTGSNKVSITQ